MTICGVIAPNATPSGSPVACAWERGHRGKPHSWADLPTFIEGNTPVERAVLERLDRSEWIVSAELLRMIREARAVSVEQPPTQEKPAVEQILENGRRIRRALDEGKRP